MWEGDISVYHATDIRVAKAIDEYDAKLILSKNMDDWLGSGIYFFTSFENAKKWAEMGHKDGWIPEPAVIKANVNLGNCMNLLLENHQKEFEEANNTLDLIVINTPGAIKPRNVNFQNGISTDRYLDYYVFDIIHLLRRLKEEEPYDSLVSAFSTGEKMFLGSGIESNNHIQIAIRSHKCILDCDIKWIQNP